MTISISHNLPQLKAALAECANQVPFAVAAAMNKVAEQAKSEIQVEMQRVFDRPTSWVLNSLRIKYAKKTDLVGYLGFKDKNSADWQGEATRTMLFPNVEGSSRHFKAMEARLMNMGILPQGYNAVPGGGAVLDANGNMSQGQISQLLNMLGTYTEDGYNKANSKTRDRLAKGNKKKGTYGFEYFVSYGNIGHTNWTVKNGVPVKEQISKNHLLPGVYQRVTTGWGSSLKPVLIFVKRAKYKTRMDFYGIVNKVHARDFEANFNTAFEDAMRTAVIKP